MNAFPTSEDRQKWVFKMPNEWLMLNPFHDDRVAYEIAFNECNRQARIVAFGAIRRAAEVAREHDRQAKLYRNDEWEPFRDVEELQCARAIRRAIRAAIGSPKA